MPLLISEDDFLIIPFCIRRKTYACHLSQIIRLQTKHVQLVFRVPFPLNLHWFYAIKTAISYVKVFRFLYYFDWACANIFDHLLINWFHYLEPKKSRNLRKKNGPMKKSLSFSRMSQSSNMNQYSGSMASQISVQFSNSKRWWNWGLMRKKRRNQRRKNQRLSRKSVSTCVKMKPRNPYPLCGHLLDVAFFMIPS